MLDLRERSPANPNTCGHGFDKHYLSQIYSIPDQWGIQVNTMGALVSSDAAECRNPLGAGVCSGRILLQFYLEYYVISCKSRPRREKTSPRDRPAVRNTCCPPTK